METYVANIPKEAHVLALEDKSNKTVDPAKRPAPMTSGCRIEGFVRVKRVNQLRNDLHRDNFVHMVGNMGKGVLLPLIITCPFTRFQGVLLYQLDLGHTRLIHPR